MCRKNEVYWSFCLDLLLNFYRGIQCDKTCNFVHGKALEVHHEMPILGAAWSFKEIQNLLQMFNFHQFFSVCHQSCVFDDSA